MTDGVTLETGLDEGVGRAIAAYHDGCDDRADGRGAGGASGAA